MGVGRVLITPELLADLLRFPGGSDITGAYFLDATHGEYVALVVSHPDIRSVERGELPDLMPAYRREPDGVDPQRVVFVDWGQA